MRCHVGNYQKCATGDQYGLLGDILNTAAATSLRKHHIRGLSVVVATLTGAGAQGDKSTRRSSKHTLSRSVSACLVYTHTHTHTLSHIQLVRYQWMTAGFVIWYYTDTHACGRRDRAQEKVKIKRFKMLLRHTHTQNLLKKISRPSTHTQIRTESVDLPHEYTKQFFLSLLTRYLFV